MVKYTKMATLIFCLLLGFYKAREHTQFHASTQSFLAHAQTNFPAVHHTNINFLSATSCAQLYKSGVRDNAQYSIDPGNSKMPFNVSCDMTDGGGWTVIQKRFDGSLNFTRNWIDYKKGFGTFDGEFWIGLNKIRRLTSIQSSTLKIVLESFDGEYRHASYSPFKVGDEVNSFILTAKNYIG